MKPSETLAKRIIEGVEAGARMVYQEDQSVRTYDFDLQRTAGTAAAVEVTSITDGTVRATFCGNRPIPVDSENALHEGLARSHGNGRQYRARRRQRRRIPGAYRR